MNNGRLELATQYVAVAGVVALGLIFCSPADAQSRPSSGAPSIISGRTLGIGKTAISAGTGWPSTWAEVQHALSSRINLGARAALLHASPYMGFDTGWGVEISAPARLHLIADGPRDLALGLRGGFLAGEGAVVGEQGVFADDVGLGVFAEARALGAWQAGAFTFAAGLGAGAGWSKVPSSEQPGNLQGWLLSTLGAELLVDRDWVLLAEVGGGGGLAPRRLFDNREVVRLRIGVAHTL